MGVHEDYSQLADRLITYYAQNVLAKAVKSSRKPVRIGPKEASLVQSISSISSLMHRYSDPIALDEALASIDLGKIYAGVDEREASNSDSSLEYEDFVVLETLKYFKNDFFQWVNKPPCDKCGLDGDNLEFRTASGPPSPNVDDISRIEIYHCKTCNNRVEFARINSATKLLHTRKGRCGEWVNCFILVLKAVLGSSGNVRYLWNHEDHVWCEYYSASQRRWIHLDPCENAYDEPTLYCDNWGKKMSWVIAIGDVGIADVSDKYVGDNGKRIPKLEVASEEKVAKYIKWANNTILAKYWAQNVEPMPISDRDKYHKLYNEVILKQGQANGTITERAAPTQTSSAPKGRQSGQGEWTKSRGEDGN